MLEWLFGRRKSPPSANSSALRDGAMTPVESTGAVSGAIELALKHHRAGRLADADAAYRKALSLDPGNIDATHFLGLIAYQRGEHARAVELISSALARDGANAPAHNNLGNVLRDQGKPKDAEDCFRKANALRPDYPDALINLAALLASSGRLDEAIARYQAALSLRPDAMAVCFSLGNVLAARGRFDEAVTCYRNILEQQPELPEVHYNLGNALKDLRRVDEAIACYRQAIAIRPDFPEAHSNLGNALYERGDSSEALAQCRKALALRPDFPEALCNLGNALKDQGQLEEAIACYGRALELDAHCYQAHSNLASALVDRGDPEQAIECCRRALGLMPEFPEAHVNLGRALSALARIEEADASYGRALALQPTAARTSARTRLNYGLLRLLQGDYDAGFRLYEHRFEKGASPALFAALRTRHEAFQDVPRWTGASLRRKTLVAWTEQGLGDSLMMLRFLPELKRRGLKRLIVHCDPTLVRIVHTMPEVDDVVPAGQLAKSTRFDLQCPLMSLPLGFAVRPETIPNHVPYLYVPEDMRSAWRQKLADIASPRIGLVWAGSELNPKNALRSVPFDQFSPLFEIRELRFVSLQKEKVSERVAALPGSLLDRMDQCMDFLDTAAQIEQLDLVIAVDTAVAHLAGALGKTVWLLNRFESEWRWMLGRDDSPWYPTMRIFRQRERGDWSEVMTRVGAALRTHFGLPDAGKGA